MVKPRNPRFFLIILVLCLCVSIQFMQLSNQAINIPMLEMNETNFDETDFEEYFLLETNSTATLPGLIFSKSGSQNLDFQAMCISPASPPPKPA